MMQSPQKLGKSTQTISAALTIIGCCILAFFLGFGARSKSIGDDVTLANTQRIDGCVRDRLKSIQETKITNESILIIQNGCSRLWYDELMLDDFTIRRIKFIEQSRDGHVLLWVVVVITLSGVALAALQLAASYQLSKIGKGDEITESEISIEDGKLSLKSSIVGLFILLVSMGFFSIFISNVYTIKEIGGVAATPAHTEPNTQTESSEIKK